MKKNWIIIILSFILVILITAIVFLVINKNNLPDNQKFSKEYTSVDNNNLFVYKTGEEIIEILENGTGVIFIGFPECPWCQAYAPMLNNVSKKLGIEQIFYYNIKEDREKETKVYKKIVNITKDYLMNNDEGNKKIFVPDIYVVQNGKILSQNNETSLIEENITPEDYWTDTKKTELNLTLTKMIEPLAAKTCTNCNE